MSTLLHIDSSPLYGRLADFRSGVPLNFCFISDLNKKLGPHGGALELREIRGRNEPNVDSRGTFVPQVA
jgi:hypothetical protein